MSISLDEYHDAVKDYLESNEDLAWLKEVRIYPEVEEKLPTPIVFFGITGWEHSDEDDGTGKLLLDLSCELIVAVSLDMEERAKFLRDAAMALSLHIDGCRFGLQMREATFLSAQPDGLVPELDEYDAWSIQFSQTVEIGSVNSALNAAVFNPSQVMLGLAPDIGTGHEADYEVVSSEDE